MRGMNLAGKTAVITGGSRGIGRAVALKMAENGADIAVIYAGNTQAAGAVRAEAAGFGVKAEIYQCLVENGEQVKEVCGAIAEKFGKVDILVNNAGITKDQLIIKMSEADFERVIDVNLKGAFNCIRHFCRHILRSPEGRIINISSVIGLTGNVGQISYAASKAGIIGLTKTAAKEFAGRGVTCNAIAPGYIETDMTAGLPEIMIQKLKSAIPLGRTGNTGDVAELAVFLASGLAGYITGEVIRVDGGMAM